MIALRICHEIIINYKWSEFSVVFPLFIVAVVAKQDDLLRSLQIPVHFLVS